MRTSQVRSPTKEKLLDAAQRLMLAKGYEATTVDEICEAAGVTKGSVFHYFESKEALGKAALDHFVSAMGQVFQHAPFRKKKDPLQRVYGYIDFAIQAYEDPNSPKSCLLGNFAQELSDTYPELRARCAHHFQQWAKEFKLDLDQAKAKYAPQITLNTRSLAEHLLAILEGSLILAKAKQDQTIFAENLRHYKRYLKTLFGP